MVAMVRFVIAGALLALLQGCAGLTVPARISSDAKLTPASKAYRDLVNLPEPKGKITVAVYGLRDQTGQYKPAPDSSFSTAVSQGGGALLSKALRDSNWFTVVERENLQDLLTERKIVRALENPQEKGTPAIQLPPLLPAQILVEGGVIAYETNVKTGGLGARYLGVSAATQYRVDQVTVNLRLIDVRTGEMLNSVNTTKTIYSFQLSNGVFTFVSFKDLLEVDFGYSRNEPPQLCLKEAIESAVVHLIAQGVQQKMWFLKDEQDTQKLLLQPYLDEKDGLVSPQGAEQVKKTFSEGS